MTRYGSAQTFEQWAEAMATLPAAMVRATPLAVRTSAELLEDTARANLAQATGGDMNLSRVRSGKGARVGVRVRVDGSGSRSRARVLPTGPVMLVERDTRPHRQPFQYVSARSGGARDYSMARRRRAARSPIMNIPGIGWRRKVNHPGTKGKEPVARAFRQSGDDAGRAGVLVFQQAMQDHLRG